MSVLRSQRQQLCTPSPTAAVSPSHVSHLTHRIRVRDSAAYCRAAGASAEAVTACNSSTRRPLLCVPGSLLLVWAYQAVAQDAQLEVQQLQADAYEAYANRDFQAAVQKLTGIIQQDSRNSRWLEMRAQVLVDDKKFTAAVQDFDNALQYAAAEDTTLVRLYAGRALAYEGLADWHKAMADYTQNLDLAQQGGESPDPYIINSLGNCQNSLQQWKAARESYLVSSQLFQQAKGFRGRGGTTTQRLDGAVYAASNAALMLAQMGDARAAVKEFERVSRRAPGSVDTRAALAALYWREGRVEDAENVWNFACVNITTGCRFYQDTNWLVTVRRWPPKMVAYLQDFLAVKNTPGNMG